MLTRRLFCGGVLGGLPLVPTTVNAQSSDCAIFTRERQRTTSPDDAIALLKAGNDRFATGKSIHCDLLAQVKETALGQSPHAAIVGCIDSRVPPEIVFDQHIGDVFCARIAGNIVNVDIIGSLEFATKVAGAKAIVILGHTACGAVASAVDGIKLGNITALLENFAPALGTLSPSDGDRTSKNARLVQKVAEANARLTAESLIHRSPILSELVASEQLKIMAAMHDLKTGRVAWLS